MTKIEVTQIEWNRKNNRTFTYWCKPEQVEGKLRGIRRAYNIDGGRVIVRVNGANVTDII